MPTIILRLHNFHNMDLHFTAYKIDQGSYIHEFLSSFDRHSFNVDMNQTVIFQLKKKKKIEYSFLITNW